jgi:hypothetical protein
VSNAQGQSFLFFRLSRRSNTLAGAIGRTLPLHLEKVTNVAILGHHVVRSPLPRSAFPTAAAWLRAQFQVLTAAAPEHLVPLLQDQRNLALAELEKGTLSQDFDPVFLAVTLNEQYCRAKRLMAVVGKAANFQCA